MIAQVRIETQSDRDEAATRLKRYRIIAIGAAFCLLLTVLVRLIPSDSTQTVVRANGAKVVVTDYWNRAYDRLRSKPPNARREVMPDGTIFQGPLKDGKKHGPWSQIKNDTVVFIAHYNEDTLVSVQKVQPNASDI